jgi:Fe-S oxidoreductase
VTLQSWFRRRGGSTNKAGPRVILWPDTFNNYFHTNVGTACVEALEAAGFCVIMPENHVCCGRPLYDYGFLDTAERYLRHTIRAMRNEIRQGTPLVGMEPSCLAVFRDETVKILPHDEDAKRLHQNSFHWAEFFEKHNVSVPKLDGNAIVWGHCHHKATGGITPEMNLLKERMGMDAEEAKGGCCGLAGSWGFETGKFQISMQCGEIGLLPAARTADPSTVIVANGFSCKTQLEQSGVGRQALHSAELMRLARKLGTPRIHAVLPERLREPKPPAPVSLKLARVGATLGLAALAAFGALRIFSFWNSGRR